MELSKDNIRQALQPLRNCMFVSDNEKSIIFAVANQFNEFVSNHGYEPVKNAVSVFAGEYKKKDITNKASYFRSAIQKILENPMMDIFEENEKEQSSELQFDESILKYMDIGFSTECYLILATMSGITLTQQEIETARTRQNTNMIQRIQETTSLDDETCQAINEMWIALDNENERKRKK